MTATSAREITVPSTSKNSKRKIFCQCSEGKNQLLVDAGTLENEEHVGGCHPGLPCARFVLDILEVRRMKKKSTEEEISLDEALDIESFFSS